MNKLTKVFLYIIIFVYFLVMCDILFRIGFLLSGHFDPYQSVNIIPFRSIISYLTFTYSKTLVIGNLLGNIIIFVPFGLFISICRDNIMEKTLIIFSSSVIIEFVQYIFSIGSSDIDDVILNTIGGVIGILFFSLLEKLFNKKRTTNLILIASWIVGIPVIVIQFGLIVTNYF